MRLLCPLFGLLPPLVLLWAVCWPCHCRQVGASEQGEKGDVQGRNEVMRSRAQVYGQLWRRKYLQLVRESQGGREGAMEQGRVAALKELLVRRHAARAFVRWAASRHGQLGTAKNLSLQSPLPPPPPFSSSKSPAPPKSSAPTPCGNANRNCIQCPSEGCPSCVCTVMNQPITVYPIFYGKFTESQKAIVGKFVASLDSRARGRPKPTLPQWWNINRWYYDSQHKFVSARVSLGPSYHDSAKSQGASLSTWQKVLGVASAAVAKLNLTTNPNGIYVVLTDNSTAVSGSPLDTPDAPSALCPPLSGSALGYCGWHGLSSRSGTPFNVALVGNPSLKACVKTESCVAAPLFFNKSASPNSDWALDSQISILAHELAEAASDPNLKSWVFPSGAQYKGMDVTGQENADVCQMECLPCSKTCMAGDAVCTDAQARQLWQTKRTKVGKLYNLIGVNNLRFIIQPNFDLRTGKCVVRVNRGP